MNWIREAQRATTHSQPSLVLSKRALARGTFANVVKMIDDRVDILEKEQQSDDNKKEYCAVQLDTSKEKFLTKKRYCSHEERH